MGSHLTDRTYHRVTDVAPAVGPALLVRHGQISLLAAVTVREPR
jgi:hypothetical protein